MTIKHSFLFFLLLVIGTILSGCVIKNAEISGTYTHSYQQYSFSKVLVHSFTFYKDGTFIYESPNGGNSGVYKIQNKDILITGQLMTAKFTIQDNGTLKGSDPEPWVKKSI